MTLIRLLKGQGRNCVFKMSQASHFSKFKKQIQLNYRQPPFAEDGAIGRRRSSSAVGVAVVLDLV